jgi:hypothetical protein
LLFADRNRLVRDQRGMQMDAAGRTAAGAGSMTAADRKALDELMHHWGEAYEIGWDSDRGWHARRRDGLGGELTAAGPDGLLAVISADYRLRPVPRTGGTGRLGDPYA